ncbi:hypothetical protein LJC34_07600 [Oscillospiraceae bacterium OttesenSCG-928-G22]|nr:hypothetical protein [Oscillospiraceae bacterium OttesenSCG-928-G22]
MTDIIIQDNEGEHKKKMGVKAKSGVCRRNATVHPGCDDTYPKFLRQ